IYREMVLGLGDLVSQRSSAKAELSLDRTTIAGGDNNPFKWAPDRRLATDLLRGGAAGFLAGPAAIAASFADVKQHMLGTLAGFEAALNEVVALTDPEGIAAGLDGKTNLLKSRAALSWADYERVHAALRVEVEQKRDGRI